MRAGQQLQRADVLWNTGGNFETSVRPEGALDGSFMPLKAYLRVGGHNQGLESRFEVWRAGFKFGGQI